MNREDNLQDRHRPEELQASIPAHSELPSVPVPSGGKPAPNPARHQSISTETLLHELFQDSRSVIDVAARGPTITSGQNANLSELVALTVAAARGGMNPAHDGEPVTAREALQKLFEVHPEFAVSLSYALTYRQSDEVTVLALELLAQHQPALAANRAVDLIDSDAVMVRLAGLQALVAGDPHRANREIHRILSDDGEDPILRSAALELAPLLEESRSAAVLEDSSVKKSAARLATLLHAQEPGSSKWQSFSKVDRLFAMNMAKRHEFDAFDQAYVEDRAFRAGVLAAVAAMVSDREIQSRALVELETLTSSVAKATNYNLESRRAEQARKKTREPALFSMAAVARSERAQIHPQHSKEELEARLKELQSGRIPQELLEESRVVDPESEAGRMFQESLEQFARTLLGDAYDFDAQPMRFLMVDSLTPQAGYVVGSHPPVFMFNRGLFLATPEREPVIATSEDLAWVLLHEIFHNEVRVRLGDNVPVGKPEEGAAYWLPLVFMQNRGMSPERALYTHEKLVNWSNEPRNPFAEAMDEHTSPEATHSGIETALALLRTQRGDLSAKSPPHHYSSADDLIVAAKTGRHVAFVDRLLGVDHGYDELSPREKVRALKDGFKKADLFTPVRTIDFADEIGQILQTEPDSEVHAEAEQLAELILESELPLHLRRCLYLSAAVVASPDANPIPVGRLKKIAEPMRQFVEMVKSGDDEGIRSAARLFVDSAKSEPLLQSREGLYFCSQIAWPGFDMPDLSHMKVDEPAVTRHAQIRWEDIPTEAEGDELGEGAGQSSQAEHSEVERGEPEDPQLTDVATESVSTPAVSEVVPWRSLHRMAREDECVLEAAILLGFYRDPAIHEALRSFQERGLRLYEQFPLTVTTPGFGNFSGFPELLGGPRCDPPAMQMVCIGMKPEVTLKDIILDSEGRIIRIAAPYRTREDETDVEVPSVKSHALFRSNLKGWAEDLFTKPDLTSAEQARLGVIAKLLSARSSLSYFEELDRGRKEAEQPLIGLEKLRESNLLLFSKINDLALRSPEGAAVLVEHFKQMVASGDPHASVLIKRFYGLAPSRDWGCLQFVLQASSTVSHDAFHRRESEAALQAAIGNPYIRAFLDFPTDIVPADEKAAILGLLLCRDEFGTSPFELRESSDAPRFLEVVRPIAEEAGILFPFKINSWEDVLQAMARPEIQKIYEHENRYRYAERSERPRLTRHDRQHQLSAGLLEAQMVRLASLQPPTPLQVLEAVRLRGWNGLLLGCTIHCLQHDLTSALDGKLSEVLEGNSVEEAVRNFSDLRGAQVFSARAWEEAQRRVIARLDEMESGVRKLNATATVLRGGHIGDPVQRARAQEIWIQEVRNHLGRDNGSEEYKTEFFKLFSATRYDTKHSVPRGEMVQRFDNYSLLRSAAKQLVGQPLLVNAMKEFAFAFKAEDAIKLILPGQLADLGFMGVRNSNEVRRALVNYLTRPYSEDSAFTLRSECGEAFPLHKRLVMETSQGIRRIDRETFTKGQHDFVEKEKIACEHIYRGFWAMPLVARAAIVRELLLPEDDRGPFEKYGLRETPQEVPPETFDYVTSKIFDLNDPETPLAIKTLKSWIGNLQPYEKHFKLAGLLVATQPSEEARNSSVANRLASATGAMSSFMKKMAQRVPGLPFVTPEFAGPFEKLTYDASDEARWQLIDWLEERKEQIVVAYNKNLALRGMRPSGQLDEKGRVTIQQYGEVLGAGSMYVAIELTMSNGECQVIALRRPHVLDASAEEFRVAQATISEMRDGKPGWSALSDTMNQVYRRLELEASCRAAPAQYELAEELYGNWRISLGERSIITETVQVTGSGEDFYLMSVADGVHLIERLRDEELSFVDRSNLAQMTLTFDLSRLLLGRFDFDRTGGQTKESDGKLTFFDFKALHLERWHDSGLEQFGSLVVRSIMSSANPGDFMRALLEEERKLREAGVSISPFVGEAKMLLLTLARYMRREYMTDEQLRHAVVSALLNGAHPAMIRGMRKAIPQPYAALGDQIVAAIGSRPESAERQALLTFVGMTEEDVVRIERNR